MAEIEIHHAHEHADDPLGPKVGVAAGIIGIILAVMTIVSHREHTFAVIHKTEANDQWEFYQAKKIRETSAMIGASILDALGGNAEKSQAAADKLRADAAHYLKESEDIQNDAKDRDAEALRAEHRALRFDLGEGLLELGLVLTSLYFLSTKKIFPVLGLTAAAIGTLLGITGFLL